MNFSRTIIAFAALVSLSGCKPAPRVETVIERPLAGVRTNTIIEIDRIVLTDAETRLFLDVYHNPGLCITIDSAAYLRGGESRYRLIGAEGIEPGAEHRLGDSGEDSFVLVFEPLDPKLETVDFIESERTENFNIWDIRLDGKTGQEMHGAAIPRRPGDADQRADSFPRPVYTSAETVVKIHMLGEPEDSPLKHEIRLTGILEDNSEVSPYSVENGTYTYLMPLYGPTQMWVLTGGEISVVFLEPGVENNVWVDLVLLSRRGSLYNRDRAGHGPAVVTDNIYAPLTAALENHFGSEEWAMSLHTKTYVEIFEILENYTPSELAAAIRSEYDLKMTAIGENPELSPIGKQLGAARLGGDYIFGMSQLPATLAILQRNRLDIHSREAPLPPGVEPFVFSDDDYRVMFDGLDPASLPGPYAEYPGYGFWALHGDIGRIFDSENTFAAQVLTTQRMMQAVGNMDVPREIEEAFGSVSEPWLREAVALKQALTQMKMEAARTKTGFRVCEVPDVQDGGVFDAIAERYSGKVVVADFWATWCGPCLAAMRNHEPHKDEYAGKEVAFIYITGENSPRAKWETAIADIKGDHYYLSDEQWRAVCDRFGIFGIPAWVVVSKDGEYFQESLYSASDWERVINRELLK